MQDVPISRPRSLDRQISRVDAPQTKTGVWGASSNLVNSIVGAGIIGIPFALNETGIVVGVLLLVLVGVCTDTSLRMIVELANDPQLAALQIRTFEDLMRVPFGNTGAYFILSAMFILAYGAMVAYLLIIKDSVPTILGLGDTFVERELLMVLVSGLLILPLCLMRDISQLAVSSLLSVACDVVLVVIVVVHAPVAASVDAYGGFFQLISQEWLNSRVFIGLGVLSTAMACQHSAFLIANTLDDPQSWTRVTHTSLTIATGLSLVLGVVGYLGYTDQVEGDVLNNFERGSRLVNGARGLLAVTMVFTYPMEAFVARHVVSQLVFQGRLEDEEGEEATSSSTWPGHKYLGRRGQVTMVLYLMTLIPALIVDDLGPVLSITGSLGASAIAYTAPGLVYLGIHGRAFLEWVQPKSSATSPAGIELPVVGDASATLQTTPSTTPVSLDGMAKPWWWYPALMPLWIGIASTGQHGVDEFIQAYQIEAVPLPARHRDFVVSMLLIVLGILAAVCGLASNLYVQVDRMFFTN